MTYSPFATLLAQDTAPGSSNNLVLAFVALGILALAVVIVVFTNRKKGPRVLGALDLDPLARLRAGLHKTRGGLLANLRTLVTRHLDEGVLDALGDVLLQADMGPETARKLVDDLKQAYREKKFTEQEQVVDFLKKDLAQKLGGERPRLAQAEKPPTVILVMGVNGTGKTTSVAKIARFLVRDNKRVLLAASDTFRAAAVEQLTLWSEKLNKQLQDEAKAAHEAALKKDPNAPAPEIKAAIEIVRGQPNQDPSSVAHDACEKALAKGFDYVLIDTAGRLHTAKNLMMELEKFGRTVAKIVPGAPHETLLVLDATTGQNAIRQAQEFTQAVKITGIVLAKLDGTAKGGIVVAIRQQLDIPVKFVGIGEGPDDIQTFDADRFAEALFT